MKICWIDVRALRGDVKRAVIEEAIHHRIDGIVSADPADLAELPPTVTRVYFAGGQAPDELPNTDLVVGDPAGLGQRWPGVEFAPYIEVVDHPSLEQACRAASLGSWVVVRFSDPTKIPLEILLAAADNEAARVVTVVADIEEAEIVFGVLEQGSDGVMLAPSGVGEAARLRAVSESGVGSLELSELEVIRIAHVGMGDRACIDTCTHLRTDEGILVGSHSKGMILACSETHPLPYMPTRPFRVNAGAIHSYTLAPNQRTNYLSELRSGSKVLAVDAKGGTRPVTVGRVKIESRPLLSVDAVAPNGQPVNLIVQDDWHVRLLGPDAVVLNVTDLKPGDRLLGHLPTRDRHVGYPIDEFCIEV
ncbi:3-dehydroquinate synthase II [Allorhizocola rhizosphaerae]|uniref:3-dehydroquinate synthase II n=1 Tax=Allorhizocola rhizosphaerae TaxID=1872709 RepID=UPI000E3E92E1|nr:3-dehydroquinate synthase II [Allorhizocola rhizosphaerae]